MSIVLSNIKVKNKLDEYVICKIKDLYKKYTNSQVQQHYHRTFNLYVMKILDLEKNIILSLLDIHIMINNKSIKHVDIIRNDIITYHRLFNNFVSKKNLVKMLRTKTNFSLNSFINDILFYHLN
jgi:hypothetical protein